MVHSTWALWRYMAGATTEKIYRAHYGAGDGEMEGSN